MACDITSGFSLACRDNIGGINSVYILSGSVTTVTAASGAISDIDGTGIFYKFELPRNVGDFTETPTPSLEAGKFFYIGRYRGSVVTGGAGTTGAAMGDANQYSLSFEATEPYPAEEITTSGNLTDALTGITVS